MVPEGFAGHEGGRGGDDEAPLDLGTRGHVELPQYLVLQADARHEPIRVGGRRGGVRCGEEEGSHSRAATG